MNTDTTARIPTRGLALLLASALSLGGFAWLAPSVCFGQGTGNERNRPDPGEDDELLDDADPEAGDAISAEDFDLETVAPAYYSAPQSRQAGFLLQAAESAAESRQYLEAANGYQRVIDEYGNKVLPLAERRFIGAREVAIAGLKALTPRGITIYQERFEPKARALLEDAVASRSESGFLEVIRRFQLTQSGRDACMMLGRLRLERGELEDARHYFGEALDHPCADDESRDQALAALVLCTTTREGLAALRTDRFAARPDGEVRVGGDAVKLTDLVERREKSFARGPSPRERTAPTRWPSYGGDRLGNRVMSAVPTWLPRQWSESIAPPVDPFRRRGGEPEFLNPDSQAMVPFPPYQPTIADGCVLINNGLVLEARQIYNGKLRWVYHGPMSSSTARQVDVRLMHTSAVDGTTVYAALEAPVTKQALTWSFHQIVVPTPERKLFALDITNGSLLWTHDGYQSSDAEETAFIRQVSMVSGPHVSGTSVFAIGSYFEGKIHSYLCAFDKNTGELQWKTLLCTGQQELNMFGQPWREYIASPISERDGVLYVCTNLGLICAVDRRLGSLLWLKDYEQIQIETTMNHTPKQRDQAWYPNPLIISGDLVYVTPLDSERLVALETATGTERFTVRRNTDSADLRYLIAARQGLLLASGAKVLALDALTGTKRWEFRFMSRRESSIGRGGASEDSVFFGSDRGLYVVDIATGKLLVDPIDWPESQCGPGNLISTGLLLLDATARDCHVFYEWDRVFADLQQRIEERPGDPDLLLEAGNIYKHQGRFDTAAAYYDEAKATARKINEAHPAVDGARRGLFDVYTTLGERDFINGDFARALTEFGRAAENTVDDKSRVESHLNFARCFEILGEVDQLLDVYGQMARELPDYVHAFGGGREDRMKTGLYALVRSAEKLSRLDRRSEAVAVYQSIIASYRQELIGGESALTNATHAIDALIKAGGRSVYARFDREAKALYEEAMKSGNESRFRDVIDLYPNADVLEPCTLALGRLLVEKGDYDKAATVLRGFLRTFPESPLQKEVLSSLASCYEKKGYLGAAVAALERVADEAGRRRILESPDYREPAAPQPHLEYPLPERWTMTYNVTPGMMLIGLEGAPRDFASSRLFFHADRSLFCISLEDGAVVWVHPEIGEFSSAQSRSIHWMDGNLVLATRSSIVSLHPDSGALNWEIHPEEPMQLRGVRFAPGSIIGILENRRDSSPALLRAWDILSGESVWEDVIRGKFYGDPVLTGQYVAIHTKSPGRVWIYDSFTGRLHWDVEVEQKFQPPTAMPGDRLFVFAANNAFQLLDLEDRTVEWSVPTEGVVVKNVIPMGSDVAVLVARTEEETSRATDELQMLSGRNGAVQWRSGIEQNGFVYHMTRQPHDRDDAIFLFRRDKEPRYYLMSYTSKTGVLEWQAPALTQSTTPASVIDAGSIVVLELSYYSATEGEPKLVILLIDSATGKILDKIVYSGSMSSNIKVVGSTLCVALGKQITALGR